MSGTLEHSPAEIIQQLLDDLNLGTQPIQDDEWPLYIDSMPDVDDTDGSPIVPGDTVGIFNTTGALVDGRIQISGRYNEQHGIQVFVRSDKESDGYSKSDAIKRAMDLQVNRVTVVVESSSYLVHGMNRTSDVIRLGTEQETSRRKFSVNFLATITQSL